MEHLNYAPEELIPIVAELASKYTGFEHSSLSYEKAQALMEAVLYFIHEWEAAGSVAPLSENSAYPLRTSAAMDNLPAREAYLCGRQIVLEKVKRLQALYNELIPDFQDYGSEFLRDTIVKGIPAFLSRYDAVFAPQETLLTLDYPILKNLDGRTGVDAVLDYVSCIFLEQRFLRRFGLSYVKETLRAYHEDTYMLTENICGVVLRNMIGHILLNKPLDSVQFTKEEKEAMKNLLAEKSPGELEAAAANIVTELIERCFDNDFALLEYLGYGIPDIAAGLPYPPGS